MNEPNAIDPTASEDDRTMPLTSSEFAPESSMPLSGGSKKRRLSSGTIVILVVVGMAGAGLFGMRKLAVASASGPVLKDYGDLLKEVLGEEGASAASSSEKPLLPSGDILKPLNVDYVAQQIPVENVQKDPFMLYTEVIREDVDKKDPPPSIDREQELQQRRKEFRESVQLAASDFKLKSVMGRGESALANINGQIVRVGHAIADPESGFTFKVWSIDAAAVVLVVESSELSLTVEHVVKVHPD